MDRERKTSWGLKTLGVIASSLLRVLGENLVPPKCQLHRKKNIHVAKVMTTQVFKRLGHCQHGLKLKLHVFYQKTTTTKTT